MARRTTGVHHPAQTVSVEINLTVYPPQLPGFNIKNVVYVTALLTGLQFPELLPEDSEPIRDSSFDALTATGKVKVRVFWRKVEQGVRTLLAERKSDLASVLPKWGTDSTISLRIVSERNLNMGVGTRTMNTPKLKL